MSKCYNFVSHVEFNHVVEVADILTVRPAAASRQARRRRGGQPGQPRQPRSVSLRHDGQAAGQRTCARSAFTPQVIPTVTLTRWAAQAHVNPDMSFAGVMPLHLAVELGHVDLVAYLLHW